MQLRPTDDEMARKIAADRPPVGEDATGEIPDGSSIAVIVAIIVAVTAIAAAFLYVLLKNAVGLSVPVSLAGLAAVALPAGTALAYALMLAARLRRHRLLAAAFESLLAPRALLNESLVPIKANAAWRATIGTAAGSAFDALAAVLGEEPDAEAGLARLRAAASEGQSGVARLPIRAADGTETWYLVAVGHVGSPTESRTGHLLLRAEEISDSRRQHQALVAEVARQEAFVDGMPAGVYVVDGSGFFRYLNRRMAEWLGVDTENLLSGGARLHDFVVGRLPRGTGPDDVLGDGAKVGEVTLMGRNGRRFSAFVCQRAGEIGDDGESGSGPLTRAVVMDLTGAERSGAHIAAAAEQFEAIFEGSPVGIALMNLEGRITGCNRAFASIASGDSAALTGRPITELVIADDRPALKKRIAEIVSGAGESRRPFEARPQARPEAVTSMYCNRLTGPDGEAIGLVIHALDTTEQSNLEVQFAQSQKMQAVGQLAGGIAHDFNNLLTAMIGFCDLLLLRHRPGEASFADVMQIKQNANRAANLVRQLLAFSRQQTLEPKVLNITDVLAELTHLLRRLIGENIELDVVHGRDLGLVRVDQGQLEQVVINLVVNARDAMHEKGGTLTIRTANVSSNDPIRRGHELMPAGNYVLTEVVDTGCGISKENLGRIFEPFYSTKEVGAGTGLGLSTVYGIVKQTGGFIFVDSTVGQGTKFSIFLPRYLAAESTLEQRKGREGDDRRDLTGVGTVLLVEDEDAVRMFSARALRNKGYQVIEASSGEEALRIIQEHQDPIHLLITDVVMPNMDGPALIQKVREMRPEMKIICISGYAEDAFRGRLARGADIHFLPKPFSLQQLAGKVKDVMQAGG